MRSDCIHYTYMIYYNYVSCKYRLTYMQGNEMTIFICSQSSHTTEKVCKANDCTDCCTILNAYLLLMRLNTAPLRLALLQEGEKSLKMCLSGIWREKKVFISPNT